MLTAKIKAEVNLQLNAAGHGERGLLATRLADQYGVSVATINRCRAVKKKRAAKRKDLNTQYRDWVKTAVLLQHKAPKIIPLDIAISGGIEAGALPREAADIPLSTAYRIIKELKLNQTPTRTHRLAADYPMQAVQIDGSSSEFLVVDRELDNGDYLLKLHRKPTPASGYKNKPLPKDKMRVLVYAIWDMCTGYSLSRYYIARGENSLDAMDFLCWALADNTEHKPFHGVPDDLWVDQGAVFKSTAACDLIERLDVNLVTGEPYNKQRMGGVERSHRTRWARFERALFLRNKETIQLSELNQYLLSFHLQENAKRPSRTLVAGRAASREAAWIALTNGRPANNRLRKLPDNPLQTMSKEVRRKVDINGIVRWAGVEYECAKLHNCWVTARRSVTDSNQLVVECERTGQREHIKPFVPRPYGVVVGTPKTELEKLHDDGVDGFAGADIYAAPPKRTGAFSMPTKTDGALSLSNPLDADHYPSIDEAIRAFDQLYQYPLSSSNREQIIKQITAADFSKQAVIDLANELLTLNLEVK